MTNTPFREQEKFAGLPDHVYRYVAALEQRMEELEGEGHSMDCDVRKDYSGSIPECSCGWGERIANLASQEEPHDPRS